MGRGRRDLVVTALTAFMLLAQLPQAVLSPADRFAAASYAGTNGRIYFVSDRTGNNDIFVMDSEGANIADLTANPANDDQVAVSAGGLAVAFVSDRTGHKEIWAMNYDGTGLHPVTHFNGPDVASPSWLPDGHIVFVSDATGTTQLYLATADGANVQVVTSDASIKLRPTASPTQGKIAYTSLRGGAWDLYVFDLFTGAETRVTTDAVAEDEPSWSPDGTKLLYDRDAGGGNRDIYIVSADGTGVPTQLTSGGHLDRDPSMSPDGTRIAFQRDGHIRVMNADGVGGINLTGPGTNDAPDWAMAVILVNLAEDPGPAACDPSACSLRGAITLANTRPGRDGIAFAIGTGAKTIRLASALPGITQPVIIDGATQPAYAGSPLIFIDGTDVTPGAPGFEIGAPGTVIAGLAIGRFRGNGIHMTSFQNQIIKNFVGLDPAGMAQGNTGSGIRVDGGTQHLIRDNVISANGYGVYFHGGATAFNAVMHNLIGTNASGTAALGVQEIGVLIDTNAHDNRIGGPTFADGNVISGNYSGIVIDSSNGTLIGANRIGTNAAGTAVIGSRNNGIMLIGASRTQIGAPAWAPNVISGNGEIGVTIAALDGVGGTLNSVQHNLIGEGLGGEALGNGFYGIAIGEGAAQNLIGGSVAAANVIAYNVDSGIWVQGLSVGRYARRNKISANSIHDNGHVGIDLFDASGGFEPPYGVTPNDAGDADVGGNDLQNFPVIASAVIGIGTLTIDARLSSQTGSAYVLEFFASVACDASRYGEGKTYLGTASATTDVSGQLRVLPTFPVSVTPGTPITATATDPLGNTSEFSACTLATTTLPGVTSDPTTVDFGPMPVATSAASLILTLTNQGSADVIISGSTIGGTNQGDFGTTTACTLITPGSFCFWPVSFAARAAGQRSAFLQISTDLGPLVIPLAGYGTNYVTGVAQYIETDGVTTDPPVILPGATVTLSSGGTDIGTTTADGAGRYAFYDTAAASQFRVSYAGNVAGRDYTAQVTLATDTYGNATVPAPPAFLNRQNHTWLTPYELQTGPNTAPTTDFIRRANESTWYVVRNVRPGDTVRAYLRHNHVDNTLLAFRDVRRTALALLGPANTSLAALQRRLAGVVTAEDMDSDDMDSEDMDSEDMDSEDMDSEDMDSEDMDSDDMDSEDMDSDDMDSHTDLDNDGVPDLQEYGDVYGSAQRKALRSGSVTPGTADESIVLTNKDYSGDLYFRVRGHAGAFDAGNAFEIQVVIDHSPYCVNATLATHWTAPAAMAGRSTLILTNTGRLTFVDTAQRTAFVAALAQLALRTNGIVVDLGADPLLAPVYANWDQNPLCVAQANAVVDSIRGVVRAIAATNPLEYVVLAGPDSAIPFARRADTAEISREDHWNVPYQQGTPLGASTSQAFYLTDDAYATDDAVERFGHPLFVPARAVGRLVETPDDMLRYLGWYFANGTITVNSALVTGYDFVSDLAHRLAETLRTSGGVPSVDDALISETWSSDDLRMRLLGTTQPTGALPQATRYDLIAAQGHYTANRLQPADLGRRFLPDELARATDGRFAGTLWASIGCHAGHNIVNNEADVQAYPLAFAETILAQGGTVVGGTGYQYGESALLTNSEALYLALAKELSLRQDLAFHSYNGDVPIGKALANAKRLYLGRLLTVRGIDEKTVAVAALYGLPMVKVHTPSQHDRDVFGSRTLTPTPAQDLVTGSLSLGNFGITLVTDPATGAQYYYAGSPENVVAPALRPVLPATFNGVTATNAGWIATGAIWMSGTYTQVAHDPLIVRPVTEEGTANPAYTNEGFAPSRPFLVNQLDPGRQTLVFAPMQYDATTGTARLWSNSTFRMYYSNATGAAALRDAPLLYEPGLSQTSTGHVGVTISVRHYASALETVDAYASYTATSGPLFGRLQSVALTRAATAADGNGWVTEFTGTIDLEGSPVTALRVFFQSAGGNGQVSTITNNGSLYSLAAVTPTPAAPKTTTHLVLIAPAATTYRAKVPVAARLTSAAGDPLAGRRVEFRLGGAREHATTDANGLATTDLLAQATPQAAEYIVVASFAETDTELSSDAHAGIVVSAAPTAIEPAAPVVHVQYSDAVTLGTLHLASRGVTLGSQAATVDVGGGRIAATLTGSSGDFVLDTQDVPTATHQRGSLLPGTYHVTLRFAGDALYAASSPAELDLIVDPEQATVAIDPPAPMAAHAVTLAGTFTQDADHAAGDLLQARVHVTLRGASGATVSGDAAVGPDGRWTIALDAGADLYAIEATATGAYTSAAAAGAVAVYDPAASVVGGGTVATAPPGRATFNISVRYASGATSPSGTFQIQTHPAGPDVRATSFAWLAASGATARLEGAATVNGVAGFTFRVTAVDAATDTLEVRVWDAAHSYASPTYTISGTVSGSLKTH
jgi:Tol biopolymer transport system component